MKIVFLNGGLANQVFQYIFYRYAQINAPEEEWLMDDSFFFVHNVHNGYELEKVFGLHPNLLSRKFDPDVWDYMIQLKKEENKSIPQILLDNGTDINMVVEGDTMEKWNPFDGEKASIDVGFFNPLIPYVTGNTYYHGYWINSEWLKAVEKEVRPELTFPEINESHNMEYLKKIQSSPSCSIHIRRGDYATLGFSLPDKTYREGLIKLMDSAGSFNLFVFSDEIDYCRTHMHEMGLDLAKETIFVEGNKGEKAFRDMQLMSSCRYMVNGNSSFCYLAALLNENLEMFITTSENRKIQ